MQKILKNVTSTAIFVILIMTIFGSGLALAQGHPGGDPGGSGEQTGTISFNSNTAVGATWEQSESDEFEDKIILSIDFVLTWTDDQGSDSDPDSFRLSTNDENNDPVSSSGNSGTVTISWDEDNLGNEWNMAVTCETAGATPIGILGLRTESDPGNSWTLTVTYTYTDAPQGPMGPPAYIQEVLNSPIFKFHIALMIGSTFMFLFAGIFAGVFMVTRNKWAEARSNFMRFAAKPTLWIITAIAGFWAFFIAAVPIGMWVAGKWYGWAKAWTGFPAMWNPEAWELTNADNVSFIVLLLWALPLYFNRAQILRSKWYKKLFGWSKFAMSRAEKAPNPKLRNFELALCYFFMGIFVFLVFMVQPHGSG
jgi:hypothetical protein